MKIYAVGGCVRDELLGRPVVDRDYVVVGATPEEMVKLGYKPVGADFPVFLHPETHEEYALARTERKTAPGYRGFVFHASPDVTLEQDLRRRDLTINAMARSADGTLIDPCGGERDLRAGILRHVSAAFSEDPVRILRVARFVARFAFSVAPETLALMRSMVAIGEADALVAERVWQEIARGLMEAEPSRMVRTLRACGALERVAPELDGTVHAPGVLERLEVRLDLAAKRRAPLAARFAVLTQDLAPEAIARLASRLNAPAEPRQIAQLAARERDAVARVQERDAQSLLEIVERSDALRRPERLEQMLTALECAALIQKPEDYPSGMLVRGALAVVRTVDAAAIARENPADVAGAIRRARLEALARP